MGDFWFRDLPVGVYDLVIKAEGFAPKTFSAVSTAECVNLGDIALSKS